MNEGVFLIVEHVLYQEWVGSNAKRNSPNVDRYKRSLSVRTQQGVGQTMH